MSERLDNAIDFIASRFLDESWTTFTRPGTYYIDAGGSIVGKE